MSGQVSLKENGILDEDLPTLLENVFKCLSKNLYLLYTEDELSNEIKLRDDIVIPNEICDRYVFEMRWIAWKKEVKTTHKMGNVHLFHPNGVQLSMKCFLLHMVFGCCCCCFSAESILFARLTLLCFDLIQKWWWMLFSLFWQWIHCVRSFILGKY